MSNKKSYLAMISLVSAMGGFLFGYDWVVIGGAKPFYEAFFGIGDIPYLQGWVMGSAILGCLLGVTVSGTLADRFGRKILMTIASVIFIISAIGTGMVDNLTMFIFYRLLGGVGIGIASNVAPMYIAEVSPPAIRGKFVSINQLTIVLGILSAQIANWLIADAVVSQDIADTWNGQWGWRWMFWAEVLPAALYFLLLFCIPESPRWLATKQHFGRAESIFEKIDGKEYARKEIAGIKGSFINADNSANIGFMSLFKGRLGRLVSIGIVIAVFQQWCGINVIFNYAQEIFSAAGYGVSDMLFNIVITGVTNVAFTFVGMYTVDKFGRKALMSLGAASLACIYVILGACYYFNITGVALLILVVLAIACYAMSLAPVTWVVISELFPNKVRGKAMAVCTFALWSACFVLTYTFPIMNSGLGAHGTFWIYGLICVLGFIFIKRNLKETKGKTLEEIEEEFSK